MEKELDENESVLGGILKDWPEIVSFKLNVPTINIGRRSKLTFESTVAGAFFMEKEDGDSEDCYSFKLTIELYPAEIKVDNDEDVGYIRRYQDDLELKAVFMWENFDRISSMLNNKEYVSFLKVDVQGLDDRKRWLKSKSRELRVRDISFVFAPADSRDALSDVAALVKSINAKLNAGVKVKFF